MSPVFPLKPLLDLSNLRLDEAARRLGVLLSGEQEASQRHALLIAYRAEYQERFVAAAKVGLSPKEWQNYRSFLLRLDDAITQAEAMLTLSKQQTSAGQKEWMDKRGDVKAYDTLASRHQSRENYQAQRREQKISDEHTAIRHRNKDDP
jgi:flagellar FliJ protein